MSVEIRQVQGDELVETSFRLTNYAFAPSPPSEDWQERTKKFIQYVDQNYAVALFEDGNAMATGTTIAMTENVRGKIFPMGGVAGIATDPAGRRKGYARRIMQHLYEKMRELGQPVSTLYPFRESFYQRLGYVVFPQPRIAQFKPGLLSGLVRQDLAGEVEIRRMGEAYDGYRAFLEKVQAQTHGMSLFNELYATRQKDRDNEWVILAKHGGETVGLTRYATKGFREKLEVWDFLYTSALGKYLLLQWFAHHGDQMGDIWVRMRTDDWLETWWDDSELDVHSRMNPQNYVVAPQGRVMLVDQLSGMQTGPGSFSAQVSDEHAPWNTGTYRFATIDGLLRVAPADEAECELTIQGLSALVYGVNDPADFVFRGWGNPNADVQARMRSMFPRQAPFLHEGF